MYLLQCIVLVVAVYCLPALAVRPSLLFNARDAVAIPVVSVLIVLLLQALLQMIGAYHVTGVRASCMLLAVIAMVRVPRFLSAGRPAIGWDRYELIVLAISIVTVLYVAVLLLLHGFDVHDEIYSWNLWAVQHVRGVPADFYYTQAPYPQLFPRLLSFCYLLLGDVSFQTAVKTALVVFPTVLFLMLGLANPVRGTRQLLLFAFLLLYILFGLNLKGRFDEGMPDTLMTTAVLVSVFHLICYRESTVHRHYLVLSVACAVVALLAKQPGLIWGLLGLPAILFIDMLARRISAGDFAIGCIPLLSGLLWLKTEGSGFERNEGVVSRSLENRGVWEQMEFVFNDVFLDEPGVLLLVLFAGFVLLKDRRLVAVASLFALPSILSWLALASYDVRAGMPGLLSLCLIIAYGNFGRPPNESASAQTKKYHHGQALIPVSILLLVVAAGVNDFRDMKSKFPEFVLGQSELNNLFELFGESAPTVHTRLNSEPPVKIWVSSNYLYGMFYPYAEVVRPDYHVSGGYDTGALIAEIKHQRPDYIARSSQVDYGKGGAVLESVANRLCPNLFEKILGPDNPGAITLYRVDYSRLEEGYCAEQ